MNRRLALRENLINLNYLATSYSSYNKGFELEFSSSKVKRKSNCKSIQFQCFDNSGCVDTDKLCDGKFDCNDHSDEINCSSCNSDQASCSYYSKQCFSPSTQRCDGKLDCPKGEDEFNCARECPEKIQCLDKKGCFAKYQVCNGVPDCADRSDERNCSIKNCNGSFNIRKHFICRNSNCIDRVLLNNGINDCGDSSDEFISSKSDNYMAISIFIGVFMSIIFIFLICRWFMHRRNINYLIANPPEFPPRRRQECDDDDAPDPDLQRGGAIFEAYLESRRQMASRRRRSVANFSKGNDIFKGNLSCPTIALASLGVTLEDIRRDKANQMIPAEEHTSRLSSNSICFESIEMSSTSLSGSDASCNEKDVMSLIETHKEICDICRTPPTQIKNDEDSLTTNNDKRNDEVVINLGFEK